MTLFKIETQVDSTLVEIDIDDKDKIKDVLKEFLGHRDCYYVDNLLTVLQEQGFNVKKVIPVQINWWEIQSVKGIDKTVERTLKSG
jgi:hypothetical protein